MSLRYLKPGLGASSRNCFLLCKGRKLNTLYTTQ